MIDSCFRRTYFTLKYYRGPTIVCDYPDMDILCVNSVCFCYHLVLKKDCFWIGIYCWNCLVYTSIFLLLEMDILLLERIIHFVFCLPFLCLISIMLMSCHFCCFVNLETALNWPSFVLELSCGYIRVLGQYRQWMDFRRSCRTCYQSQDSYSTAADMDYYSASDDIGQVRNAVICIAQRSLIQGLELSNCCYH